MSTNENTSTEKLDVYAKVTSQIVNAIEQGVGNWRMPWHTSGRFASSPINATSRKAYRGINTVCLWAAAESKGYDSGEWATYAQWQERAAQVRKGEKATTVVFWKFANGTAENQDGDESVHSTSRLLFTRGYAVFNAAQVDGYTPKAEPAVSMPERIERAETWFQSIGADVRNGGNRAYYSPGTDHIQIPPLAAFAEDVSYYSTLAHEHTHWTARAERCDRQLGKRFGDTAYAAEELIAELGAAFVCAHLGLSTEPREDHAQYIQSWLKVLRADKRAIFTAASQAQKAADYLIQRAGGIGPRPGGGGMTGRYRISMLPLLDNGTPRAWEPEKRTAQRWHLFADTCRSLAADGLDYAVTFALAGNDPHILITASGTARAKCKPVARARHGMVQRVKPAQCAVHAQEAAWFLPENRERRNGKTTHWRTRAGRYAALNAMAEENLRAELEFWRELELLSGQREHFKPGRTDETAYFDDEVAA